MAVVWRRVLLTGGAELISGIAAKFLNLLDLVAIDPEGAADVTSSSASAGNKCIKQVGYIPSMH